MNAQPDTFAGFLDVLAADLDDHEARAEDRAARAAPVPVSLRSGDPGDRGRAAGCVPASDPDGACGVPARDEPRRRAPAGRRRRLLLERGVHAGVPARVRRHAVGLARPAGADPAGLTQRRPLPPAGRPAPARRQRGQHHEPAHSHGRTPPLARRRDGRPCRKGSTTRRWTGRSSCPSSSSTTSRRCASSCRGSSARWTCGRTSSRPRLRHGHRGPRVRRRDLRRASTSPARRSWPRSGGSSRAAASTRRSSTPTVEPAEVFTYGGLIAHVLTFAAHRRLLVLGALESAGIPDLGNGDPRLWVAAPA